MEITAKASPKKVKLPDGRPFYCVDHREIPLMYRELFEERVYLQHDIELTPNMTVFDVGANVGMATLFFAENCPSARVFSFEPLPPTYAALRGNLELHGLTNVKSFNIGLSEKEGAAEFKFYPYSAGWSTMRPNHSPEFYKIMWNDIKSYDRLPVLVSWIFKTPVIGDLFVKFIVHMKMTNKTFRCSLRRLSDVIREQGVNRIDLLKVDVERAEWDVLNGIDEADWPKIQQAVVEAQNDIDPQNSAKIVRLLESKGFQVVEKQADYLLREDGSSCNSAIYAKRVVH